MKYKLPMKNKKANILEENTLSTIIAVIGILLILFVIYKVYIKINEDSEINKARTFVQSLSEKINAVKINSQENITLTGFSAEKTWYILAFDKNQLDKPDKCLFDSCVCVCPGVSTETCQKQGLCESVETEKITIKTTYIPIPQNLIKMEVTKTEKEITLFSQFTKIEVDEIIKRVG
ncbi:hypothetical protein HY450_03880 [Candidatus Pacearchaeota archaeon]|nr:hypothetical protein [Candidatus Pacearchaeota archaeon]